MSDSLKRAKRALSVWQFGLMMGAVYLLGLLIAHNTVAFEQVYWSGYELESLDVDGKWTKSNRYQIGSSDDIQTLRFHVSIDDTDKWRRPVGLMIGGPFSAEIFWDQVPIGQKGHVGYSTSEEIAGPIDFATFVPSHLLTPGVHNITIRLSTQHLFFDDVSVFHHIHLAPYRENGRRDLRYYAIPLLLLSALMVLSVQSFRIGCNAGNTLHLGLGAFGFSISVLLVSEVFRAIVNYPYPYHELRGAVGWISNIVAGGALMYTSFKCWASRQTTLIYVIGSIVFVCSQFVTINSGDYRMALNYLTLLLPPTLVCLISLFQKRVNYLSLLPLFGLACLVSNYLSVGLFLDSYQFISALILIGGAWVWVYVDVSPKAPVDKSTTRSSFFTIKNNGVEKKVPISNCYALKGEGNYTSLMLNDGTTILHQDGIGVVVENHSTDVVRVHKSYAVNINEVSRLKSATGSKYWLEMNNKQTVPVSRYRVVEIRGLLEMQSNNK